MGDLIQLKLSQIVLDGGTQARAETSQEHVDELAEAAAEGAELPAIDVCFDGEKYWPWDGFHRIYSAQQLGNGCILARVRPGGQRDAVLLAVGSNVTHGLKRTLADKRRAAEMLLTDEEWQKWSDREIAKRCWVSHNSVANWRKELGVQNGHPNSTSNGSSLSLEGKRRAQTNRVLLEKIVKRLNQALVAAGLLEGLEVPLDLLSTCKAGMEEVLRAVPE